MDRAISNAKGRYSVFTSRLSKSPYTFQHPRTQYFSFPATIISRIFNQKESIYFLIKIYQTCKYFFKIRSILPVYNPAHCFGSTVRTGSKFHNFGKKVLFWFNYDLYLSGTCQSIRDRIYCCTIVKLYIGNLKITYNEFARIISNSTIEDFTFKDSKITYSNGSTVPLNFILEHLYHVSSLNFEITIESCSNETLTAMNQLTFLNKLIRLNISIISVRNDFDAEIFWKFVKKNLRYNSTSFFNTMFLEGNKKKRKLITNLVETTFNNVFDDWDKENPKIHIALNEF